MAFRMYGPFIFYQRQREFVKVTGPPYLIIDKAAAEAIIIRPMLNCPSIAHNGA